MSKKSIENNLRDADPHIEKAIYRREKDLRLFDPGADFIRYKCWLDHLKEIRSNKIAIERIDKQ